MNFGEALQALKDGKKVARAGWNTTLTRDPSMPGFDHRVWLRRVDLYCDKEFSVREIEPCFGTWMPFIARKTADNQLAPWDASQADMLADDWLTGL